MNLETSSAFLQSNSETQDAGFEQSVVQSYLQISDDIVLVTEADRIRFANSKALDLFRISIDTLLEKTFCSYLKAKDELKFKRWILKHQPDEVLYFYLRISQNFSQFTRIKHVVLNAEKDLHILVLTPLNKYQEQLNQTMIWKNRYQLFTDLSNQLFFEWDIHEYTCVWGKNFRHFFGEQAEENDQFEFIYAFVHPKHEELLQDAIRSSLFKGQKLDLEVMLEGPAGGYQWCRIVGDKHEEDSKRKKLIGVIINIHENKQHQKALLNSQTAFRSILENMNEVFFRTDNDGNIILINKAALSMFKLESLDDILGKHVLSLYYNQNDRKSLLNSLEEKGQLDSYIISLKDSEGKEIIVQSFIRYYYDDTGELGGTEGVFYDVTESRKVDMERERILKELRSTLSSARVHIYRYKKDADGRFVYSFSEGRYPVKEGKTTKDIYGKTFEEVYGKEQEAEERNAVNMAFEGKSVSFISKWNGEFFQSDIAPFSSEDGVVQEVIGVIYNINEVIEAEKALIESEEKYKALVENAQDGIVIIQDARFVFVNNTFVKLLGYTRKEELIGKPIQDIIHPEHMQEVVNNHMQRMEGEDIIKMYETVLVRSDGSEIPAEINNNLIQYEGANAGLTFVRDLTQRKKDRDELVRLHKQNEVLLGVFPLIYAVATKEGTIKHINIPESMQMDYLHKFIKPNITLNDLPLNQKNIEKISYYHNKLFDVDATQRFNIRQRIGDKMIHFEFRMIRLSDNEALTTVDDITDRLEYQKRLIVAKEKAEESDRLKSAFLANMSHEIRTPMNAILGFAEMLSYPEIEDDEREEFVDIIKRRGYDLLHIINDIIDVSKMEAGLMNFNIEAASVNAIVKDVVSSFLSNEKVREGNIRLLHNLGLKDGRDMVMVDPVRLKQVFINLLNNAIKFTEKGNVSISYSLDEEKLYFVVEDTGIGIKKESQGIIFDRFMQAEMDKSRNYGGTGLGLTISKNIVEKLGGSISFESEYGRGSKFFFDLPYVKAGSQQHYPEETVPTDVLANKNILIAEDEETNYLVLSSILEKYNINCIHAHDGMEALKFVQEMDNIDLILMDIRMPRLNGIEATTEITRISKIPVIMQTAYAFDKDINQALEAGAKDFVAKPISASKLISKLVKFLK